MGAGDKKKVCCEAAIAPKILGLEKRQHPIIGETNVFRQNLCGLSLVFIKDWRVVYNNSAQFHVISNLH